MASEDVLDRLDRMMNGEESDSRSDLESMCEALAAEVRELRAKLDSEASHRLSLCADNERFTAEIERLRADLVWALKDLLPIGKHPKFLLLAGRWVECGDGTPESICRAVRSAREEREDGD